MLELFIRNRGVSVVVVVRKYDCTLHLNLAGIYFVCLFVLRQDFLLPRMASRLELLTLLGLLCLAYQPAYLVKKRY